MRQDGEPTIEEILESIKRVIAREDRGERLARQRAGPAGDASAERDDVLDLAQHDYGTRGSVTTRAAPLVAEGTSASMRGSLDALASANAHTPATDRAADSGLESLVRDLLRPALSDWLDRNLPAIVERMVAAEIARITQRRD